MSSKKIKDFREILEDKLVDYLNKKDVILVKTSNAYVRFVDPIIREKVGLIGDGTWEDIKDLIVYEISNSKKYGVQLNLILGPGKLEDREKWYDFALKNKELEVWFKYLRKEWNTIYHYNLANYRNTYSSDDDYYVDVFKNLDKFFDIKYNAIREEFK